MFRLLTSGGTEVRRGPMNTLRGILYTATCMGCRLERWNDSASRWEIDSAQWIARQMKGWRA